MSHHACFAMPFEFLDIVVVEDSKPMQMILRSMLSTLHARRIRLFDNGVDALQAMAREPPNLIVTDLRMPGMSGLALLRTIRAAEMDPLCFVPAIVVTAHATHTIVEEAMRCGAHLVLAKPVAPTSMIERIAGVIRDPRRFVLGSAGSYVIEGVPEKLAARQSRIMALQRIRSAERRARLMRSPEVLLDRSVAPRASARPQEA
jgi:two-component system phosphate regulon response regulator PhoB